MTSGAAVAKLVVMKDKSPRRIYVGFHTSARTHHQVKKLMAEWSRPKSWVVDNLVWRGLNTLGDQTAGREDK